MKSIRVSVPKMYKLFIGGKFTRTESERYIRVTSSKNDGFSCNISRASRKDVRNAVVAARSGFNEWSKRPAYERAQILYRLAEMLEERKEQFAERITLQTASAQKKSSEEITRAIDRIIFYAGLADKWQQLSGTVNPVQPGYFNFSISEPTGVVGIILPETPTLIPLISRICTAMVTGNSVVVICPPEASLPVLTFSEVIATSDFPAGSVNLLTGVISELAPHIAGHLDVNALDYCNSDKEIEKEVMKLCANNVKRFNKTGSGRDWFSTNNNENILEPSAFTEIKTVWHTVGM